MNIHEVKKQLESSVAPVVKVIHKTESNRIIALGLRKGIVLKEHKASVPARLIVLEGSLQYKQEGEIIELHQHDEHEIPVGILHSVEGLEDSIAILIH